MPDAFHANLLEPGALVDLFLRHPPKGFSAASEAGLPVFGTDFDLLTTLEPSALAKIRRLPLFGLCLGWPADNPDLKPRIPAAMLVHENHYQPVNQDVLNHYDEELANYYMTRGSNNRRDTWTDHIRRTIIKENRPFILEYLHKQGWATR